MVRPSRPQPPCPRGGRPVPAPRLEPPRGFFIRVVNRRIAYGQSVMYRCLYFGVSCFSILLNFAPSPIALAQELEKPAIAPLPRTVNLTQVQRFMIKEIVEDLPLPKAPSSAPETIGDIVAEDIKLYSLPPLAAKKVAQARSHFFSSRKAMTLAWISRNRRLARASGHGFTRA
jgi:hypothetical protein